LVLLLALGFQSFNALAANDLDKWNSPEGRQVRTALKNKTTPTTTYKEKPNLVDAEYRSSSNAGKILHRIEHATTASGSKKGVTIEALKQVDKSAVAKKWANQIFKGGDRFTAGAVLVEVAMQEMLDGLDWVMGEGSQIQKKPTPEQQEQYDLEQEKYTSPSLYRVAQNMGSMTNQFYSVRAACLGRAAYIASLGVSTSLESYSITDMSCTIKEVGSKGQVFYSGATVARIGSNPDYNPAYVPEPVPTFQPTKQEAQQKITDYLNTSPNTSKDLLIEEAYK